MKKILIAIACAAAVFFESCNGCKEVPPTIDFRAGNYSDTTYTVSPVPAAQAHNVLVEEYTGASCTNCPAGHAQLDADVSANPAGRINIISLYDPANPLCAAPSGAAYDFEDSAAHDILYTIFYVNHDNNGFGALPGAGIDRMPLTAGGTTYLSASSWDGFITTRLGVTDSVNLDVSSTYNDSSGIATIDVKITYVQPSSTLQNLSIVVVEDSIIDYQEFPFGVVNHTYLFNGVFVGLATAEPWGDPILSSMSTKAAGRVDERKYTYRIPTSFKQGLVNPHHCRVIAFVNRPSNGNSDFEILQSQQAKLVGP